MLETVSHFLISLTNTRADYYVNVFNISSDLR